jgi:tetratricopeptide (TPR) repeat protein
MYGHASDEQQLVIDALEEQVAKSGNIDDLLRLAQVYIEPAHEEHRSIALLERVLESDPENATAKIWLAYCCIHVLMEEKALLRAVRLLESVIESKSQSAGAAYMLLAEAFGDRGDLSLSRKIELLEASTNAEPDWVFNHIRLGRAYREAKRTGEALAEFEVALRNLIESEDDSDLATEVFQSEITGRRADRKPLEQEAQEIGAELRAGQS